MLILSKVNGHSFTRVELEEGYQNSLDRILHNLELPACDPDQATGIHKALVAHVDVDTQQRAARTQYIQTMKGQLQRLAELKVMFASSPLFFPPTNTSLDRRNMINQEDITEKQCEV